LSAHRWSLLAAIILAGAFATSSTPALAATTWQRFFVEYRYEAQTRLDYTYSRDAIWSYGQAVCRNRTRGYGPANMAYNLNLNTGLDGAGAEATVAAALRVICPRYNTGYRTYFDRNVSQARELIHNGWGRYPPEVPTGETAKLVCGFLSRRSDATGLTSLMHSEGTPGGAPIKLTVRSVVSAACPGQDSKLGPYWYD
jgi:hypothetical protein